MQKSHFSTATRGWRKEQMMISGLDSFKSVQIGSKADAAWLTLGEHVGYLDGQLVDVATKQKLF